MKNFQFGVIKRPLRSTSINENKSFCLFAYSSFLTPLFDKRAKDLGSIS